MAADHQIGSKSRDVGWYDEPIISVDPSVRELLEKYSNYAPSQVLSSAVEMRDKIWDVFPWPCVGQFRFLDLSLSRSKSYSRILDAIKDGERFLDVGCCFAQDMRKLVYDGAPAEHLYGLEIQAEFISLAYQFFRDEALLAPDHFLTADLMDRADPKVQRVAGTFGIVHLGMILHTWDRENQLKACQRAVELLRSEPGVLVVGQCVGHIDGVQSPGRAGKSIFKHNEGTFRDLWKELEKLTNTKWEVRAQLDQGLGIKENNRQWDDPRTRRLVFEVERLPNSS